MPRITSMTLMASMLKERDVYEGKTFALPEFPPGVAPTNPRMAMDDANGSMQWADGRLQLQAMMGTMRATCTPSLRPEKTSRTESRRR